MARDKFEHVCSELSSALKREQQAQTLLNEQSSQMRTLSKKLDHHLTDGSAREHTLEEAVQVGDGR